MSEDGLGRPSYGYRTVVRELNETTMIATRQECLTADELKDLLAGRLPTERFARALAHVDTCQACADVATESEPTDCAILERSAHGSPVNLFQQEPECQAMMGQLLLQTETRFQSRDNPRVPIENLGPYRLVKWLGSGGMGAVYLAEHQRLKRLSAIKLLPRDKLLQADWLERFNREMTSIAALEHPHVVRAFDAGDQDGWHYLVMEYLDGADLGQVCRCVGQLPIGTACELVRQAALGLAAIHELGMTHRDIKPSNMFLTRQGIVKLLDLGLVLSGDSPLAADERLTTVGHLMGTLPYMAREQLLDASEVDWRADIYSLGATLFRMLTGQAPLGSAKNLAQTIQAITTGDCPKLESLLHEAPRDLSALINSMLSHDRQQRPQSAGLVAERLAAFSDADALQPLIRTTLSELELSTETNGSALNNFTQSGMQTIESAAKPPSRRPLWIAAAFLPVAFLAGIFITVATDRGTLVIESEEPGVTVKVTQGDKTVDTLKVENQPGVLRLSSGRYVVELVGADGDSFVLSESQVTVLRGQKELIRVKKQSTEQQPPVGEGNFYQGKSFSDWMFILEREKDVDMIAKAMQAVAWLAEKPADRLAAARRVLEPARYLGSYTVARRPQGYTADVSGWYMTELLDHYHHFLPAPGLEAIIRELDSGRVRSAQACLMLLEKYGHRAFGLSLGPNVERNLAEHLQTLTQSEDGSNQLKDLLDCLIKVSKELKNEKWGTPTAIRQAVAIARLLNEDLSARPEFVAWAKELLAAAEDSLAEPGKISTKGTALKRSPLDAMTALNISQVLKDEFSAPLLLGLLESPYPPNADFEKQLTEALDRMVKLHPAEMAAAIEHHFERIVLFAEGIVQDRLRPADATTDRVRLATQTLLAHAKDRQKLIATLKQAKVWGSPQSIFSNYDVSELIKQLE